MEININLCYLSFSFHATSHICLPHCFFPPKKDLRTFLILPIQLSPDLANLSHRPTHLLSITPQTNWSVTPLSGPRLHFSSHPSPPKHSFFFTVTSEAGPTPTLSSCVPWLLNCLYLQRLNLFFSTDRHPNICNTPVVCKESTKKIKGLCSLQQ